MIDIVAEPNMAHHVSHAHALQVGLERHGVESRIRAPWQGVEADTCACWGWRLAAPLVRAGKRVLVMEHGYIGDRKQWTSLGWNGLNGRAQFAQARDEKRFDAHFDALYKPWQPGGEYALLVGQVDGDASLYGMDFCAWAVRAAGQIRKHIGLPVMFRPHPVAIEFGQPQTIGGAKTLRGHLADAIAGAAVVVTFNSNTATEAMLAGKPTVTLDPGAVAWPVAAHEYRIQDEPDRLTWAREVAWRQFTMEEIRSGFAWECQQWPTSA